MSNLMLKTTFLLSTVFPTILDLFYKEDTTLKFQSLVIFRAGYLHIVKDSIDINSDKFKIITLEFIENIKGYELTPMHIIFILDNFCSQYLSFVKKERKYLWEQLQSLIVSDKNYIKFTNSYVDGNLTDDQYSCLELSEEVTGFIEQFMDKRVCH